MQIAIQDKVKDLALAMPGSTRIFEKFGIDYCCGGGQSLAEACASARVASHAVMAELEKAQTIKISQPDWNTQRLSTLIEYILTTHHEFTRNELERLDQLAAKVRAAHSERHPELVKVEALLHLLKQELIQHMFKEERVLFPYVIELETAVERGAPLPSAMFGTICNPIQMMTLEHETVGEVLREMRRVTKDYALPTDACQSYQTLYDALPALEADLHEHIHLENNLLFPRATALESPR